MGGGKIDMNIRKQYVYVDTPSGIEKRLVHPVTETKAIVDMDLALDSYTESFIHPYIDNKMDQAMVSSLPIGFIFPWVSVIPPIGCLKLNGTLINRDAYNRLFDFATSSGNIITDSAWNTLSTTQSSVGSFSSGDGSTTFRLPLMVDFIRGTSGTIGEWQGDAIRNITGSLVASANQGNQAIATSLSGAFSGETSLPAIGGVVDGNNTRLRNIYFNASNVIPTATENRPKTIRYQYYIKSFNVADEGITYCDLLPAGAVFYTASSNAPKGSLKANGAILSRTVYHRLFEAISTIYGSGDGSTTFKIPDIRGEFIRSLSDGSSVDNNRVLGSTQGDAIRNFPGRLYVRYANWGNTSGGGFASTGPFVEDPTDGSQTVGTSSVAGRQSMNFDPSKVVPTANENRPRNVALLACIKY